MSMPSKTMKKLTILPLLFCLVPSVEAFVSPAVNPINTKISLQSRLFAATTEVDTTKLRSAVSDLKKCLLREYTSFFNPMEREFYSPTVSFDDPMTSLAGVDAYQNNVDMLSSRTVIGKFLFEDAGIVLHSVEGGDVEEDGSISNIITRWTLRVTAKVLPWRPTARFSGISVYDVVPGGPKGVLVEHQTDYWDSINLQKGGTYQKVASSIAVKDFLNQLKPENAIAPSAGPELPYQLLRRGNGYEVREYPSYSAVKMPYERRDEAFLTLGSFTAGMSPLAPAIMDVNDDNIKSMKWPLSYAAPGQTTPPDEPVAKEKLQEKIFQMSNCEVETIPEKVVAVGSFTDASMEPVVRKADRELRAALERDGLQVEAGSESRVTFAQYDAVFSMGKRRGEVWIPLANGGHPW